MRGTDGGAGASAWARYRLLAAEHRQERMVVRLALAAAAGIVASGISWWAGPVAAVAVFAGHVWYLRSRPGALAGWRSGALAERRTGRVLARLDPAAFHVLHDRALPDAPAANLDHLVIGLTGVYAITTRTWGGWPLLRRGGRPFRLRAARRRLWLGDRPLLDLPAAAARAGRTVEAALGAELDHEISVTALVAVHAARPPRAGLRFGGVVFQPVRQVPRFLQERPIVFTSAQVATIAAAAERLLPPMLDRPWR